MGFLNFLMPHSRNLWVSAVASISADGCIADANGNQDMLTNTADRLHLKAQMEKADALVVGRKTYQQFSGALKRFRCLVVSSKDTPVADLPHEHHLWNPATQSFPVIATRLGFQSLCVLGGAQVYTTFLKESLLDELILTLFPGIFLKPSGLPLFLNFPDELIERLNKGELDLKLVDSRLLSGVQERADSPRVLRFSRLR